MLLVNLRRMVRQVDIHSLLRRIVSLAQPDLTSQCPRNVYAQAFVNPQGRVGCVNWPGLCLRLLWHVPCHSPAQVLYHSSAMYFPERLCNSDSIKAIHSSGKIAKKQICSLFIAFGAAFVWSIVRDYPPGILKNWDFFWWFYLLGAKGAVAPSNWGWGNLDTTPCFFGLGDDCWVELLVELSSRVFYGLGGHRTHHSGPWTYCGET